MKQIKDHSLFLQEHIGGGQQQKRQQLMDSLAETVGILATYPESVRNQFLSIAEREGEEDREGTQL